VKLLRKRNVKDNIDDYIPNKFDDSLVYAKDTSNQDIKNDILVKWIITNSQGNNTKRIIQSHNKTSFLRKSYTKSEEQQKIDLKEEIDNMKYSINYDINTFIVILQNSINDLENLEGDMADPIKVDILNRALPENLRFINVFRYKSNWNKCCKYFKVVIPEIIF